MDNQRLIIFFVLGVLMLFMWNAWESQYGTTQPAPQQQAQSPAEHPGAPDTQASADTQTGQPPAPGATPTDQAQSGKQPGKTLPQGKTIHIRTDVLDVEIDTVGGTVRRTALLDYNRSSDDKRPLDLLYVKGKDMFVAQSGLHGKGVKLPGPDAVFEAPQSSYELSSGQDKLVVPLTWEGDDGVKVVKRFIFHRGRYLVDVDQDISNSTPTAFKAYQYVQLRRSKPEEQGSMLHRRSYVGGVIYSPEDKYQKVSFDDMADKALSRDVTGGWLAMVEHYFVAAWVPPQKRLDRFYTQHLSGDQYVIGMSSPQEAVPAGGQTTINQQLFLGPKDQDRLEGIAPGLELAVDYGFLTVIAKPLFWLLKWIHGVVGNWGFAIILLTVLIKLVFYKLSETSYRSMAKMRRLQPRMKQLKERFGDDRQAMNQAMMGLYKEEKINPLGGCLPIVVQIPVFIALYWVLLGSVELRQADFILWIHDLSAPDPYFVLPILMGVTMLVQQRLNPAPMDPIQQKVMMFLPVVFTVFFLFFPAGLVVYWVTNNSLSILQQWLIMRRLDKGGDGGGRRKKKAAG